MFVVVRPAGDEAAITTASPGSASPCSGRPSVHQRDHPVGVLGRLGRQRLDTPEQARRSADVLGRDERVHGDARALGRQEAGGSARLGVAGDRDDPEVLEGDRADRVRDRGPLAHRRAGAGRGRGRRRRAPRRRPRSWSRPRPTRTGSSPTAVSPDSITASAPSSTAFATSVVSARVGPGRRDHRLEHLRGHDRGPAGGARLAHEVLLDQRDLLHRELHAEIAARDHQRVGLLEDPVHVLDGGTGLDLRHDRHDAVAHQRRGARGRPRGPDERLRDQVGAQVERASQALAVAVGHRRQTEPLGGHVHPLARTDRRRRECTRCARRRRRAR